MVLSHELAAGSADRRNQDHLRTPWCPSGRIGKTGAAAEIHRGLAAFFPSDLQERKSFGEAALLTMVVLIPISVNRVPLPIRKIIFQQQIRGPGALSPAP
jgi:hypothetical protein